MIFVHCTVMNILSYVLLMILYHVFILLQCIKLEKIEVKVKQGVIKGVKERSLFNHVLYYAFYGVPYAEAPVKELRFKDPAPKNKFKGKFDGRTEYKGACAQTHIIHNHGLYGVEDCLLLNIFTPKLPRGNSELIAVIVWFHGHAFTSSFSHMFGPDFLIENNVLFVTVTYRIGVFGFLKTNDGAANGNMGLKDIKMSLKWIKDNIKSFSGDSDKVTVMGSDSAGTLLSLLFTSSHKMLFSQMIIQSGSMFSPSIFQVQPEYETNRLFENLKKTSYNNIFMTPATELLNVSRDIYNSTHITNFQRPVIPFTPIIDGKGKNSVLMQRPEEFMQKAPHMNISVPLLIGYTSQESVPEILPFLHNPHLLNNFQDNLKFMIPFSNGCAYKYRSKIYRNIENEIKKKYFGGKIDEMSLKEFIRYTSDLHIYPVYHMIKKMLEIKKNSIYVYKFNYRGQFNAVTRTATAEVTYPLKGAAKGDEICYLLKCELLHENYLQLNNNSVRNVKDKNLIKEMAEMWANFAKFGNPTPEVIKNTLIWRSITRESKDVLYIGKTKQMREPYSEEVMYNFWRYIYETYYNKRHCKNNLHTEL